METTLGRYEALCHDLRVGPHPAVVQCLEGDDGSRALSLSSTTHSSLQWKALAKCLILDVHYTHVSAGDCLLGDEGCAMFCSMLATNSFLKSIDLRQNRIRYYGALALGAMLKKNSALEELGLEWNAIGAVEGAVDELAVGLAHNQKLLYLDLRSNQISHKGCAALAEALLTNYSLRSLDLRWNNIGNPGAQKLLEALEANRSLTSLHLDGNHIGTELLQAIEARVDRNLKDVAFREQEAAHSVFLNNEIEKITASTTTALTAKDKEIRRLQDALDALTVEKGVIEEDLREYTTGDTNRRAALAERLALSEQARETLKTQLKDMSQLVMTLKHEASASALKASEDQHALSKKHERVAAAQNEQIEGLRDSLDALKRQAHSLQDGTVSLEGQKRALQGEAKALKELHAKELAMWKGQLEEEKLRKQDDLDRLSSRAQADLLQNKSEAREEMLRLETARRHAEEQRESARLDAERIRAECKADLAAAQARADERVAELEKRFKAELASAQRGFDDKEQALRESMAARSADRTELERTNETLRHKITELTTESGTLRGELAHLSDTKSKEGGALSQELADARQRERDLNARLQAKAEELATVRAQQQGTDAQNKELVRKNSELTASLAEQRERMAAAKASELKRAAQLESCIQQYVTGAHG